MGFREDPFYCAVTHRRSPIHLRTAEFIRAFIHSSSTDLTNLIDALRRAIRLKGRAVSTEETYVYWNRRFIRFCFQKLGQAPKVAGASRSSPLSGRLARI